MGTRILVAGCYVTRTVKISRPLEILERPVAHSMENFNSSNVKYT